MAKVKCNIDFNNQSEKDAVEHVETTLKRIDNAFDTEFGAPENQKLYIKNDIKEMQKERKEMAREGATKKELIAQDRKIVNKMKELKQADEKFKKIKEIKDLITKRLQDKVENNFYLNSNPEQFMSFLKDWLMQQYSIPINEFKDQNLQLRDLKSIYNTLANVFNKQDKLHAKLLKKGKLTNFQDQVVDPMSAMWNMDFTGRAMHLINETRNMVDRSAAQSNRMTTRLTEALDALSLFLDNNPEFDFRMDGDGRNTQENLIKLGHMIMDGEVKLIKPRAVGWDPNNNKDFLEDEKEYWKIINEELTQGVRQEGGGPTGIGRKIQIFTDPDTNQQYAYVIIKKEGILDNATHYNAYTVPVKYEADNKTINSIDLKEEAVWNQAFQNMKDLKRKQKIFEHNLGALKANKLLELMQEGWHQAATQVKVMRQETIPRKKGESDSAWIERKQKWRKLPRFQKKQNQYYTGFSPINKVAYINNKKTEGNMALNQRGKTEVGELPPQVWRYINEIKEVLKDTRNEAVTLTEKYNQRMNKLIKQYIGDKTNLSTEETRKIISDVMGIDGLGSTTWVSNGKVYTPGSSFAEIEDYSPYRYHTKEILFGLVRLIESLDSSIETTQEEINIAKNQGKDDIVKLKELELQETELLKEITNFKLDVTTGARDIHDVPPALKEIYSRDAENGDAKLRTETMIKYARNRSLFMSPMALPETDARGDQMYSGRRMDFDVYKEYVTDTYRALNQTDVKTQAVDVLRGQHPAVQRYLIDQLKASFGHQNIEAGIFGVDYSDETWIRRLNKIPGININPQTMAHLARMHGFMVSGNLLGMGAALNNNAQRMSNWIEIDNETRKLYDKITSNKNLEGIADNFAERIGVLDVLTSMADSISQAMGKNDNIWAGVTTIPKLLAIKASRRKFIVNAKKTGWAGKVMEGFKQQMGRDLDLQSKEDELLLEKLLGNWWDLLNTQTIGKDGKPTVILDKARLKHLKKSLRRTVSKDFLNTFTQHTLQGGMFVKGMSKLLGEKGTGKYLSFHGVEGEMRTQTAFYFALRALQTPGLVPNPPNAENMTEEEILKWKLFHKDSPAIKFARVGVYNTMFGMSPQFISKMFRGAIGTTLWKFKPYTWHQMRNEWRTMKNYAMSIDNKALRGAYYLYLFGAMATPGVGVAAAAGTQLKKIMKERGGAKLSNVEEKKIRLQLSRMLISNITAASFFAPPLKKLINAPLAGMGINTIFPARRLERGAGSALVGGVPLHIMRVIMSIGFFSGDDQDDDWIDLLRIWGPMYIMMWAEAIYSSVAKGNPVEGVSKVLGVYSKNISAGMSALNPFD